MCGIVGLISRRVGGFWSKDLDVLEQMLLIDSLRGKDATGAFTVYKNKQAEVIKLASHPYHLFACTSWHEFRSRVMQRGRVVIGHNRAATRGDSSKTANAHPFVEDNIILVHNGTLWDHKNLTKKDVEVDSNAVAHALSGDATPDEVLPKINGAFALVWYNTLTDKVYAIRNEQRPLCLIETDENYVLSSEPLIAAVPLDRNNHKVKNIEVIEPGVLYEFGEQGRFTTRKIDLSKKANAHSYHSSQTSGRSGTGTANYSGATRGAVHNGPYDHHLTDEELAEDDLPFAAGTASPLDPARVPQAVKDLRAALAEQAKTKGALARSTVCALTQKNGGQEKETDSTKETTGRTPVGLSAVEVIEDIDKIADNNTRMIQITHPSLARNRKVLFRVTEFYKGESGRWRFRGKLHQPGEALEDVIGVAPPTWTAEALAREFVGKFAVGYIHFVTSTNGGISVYIRNMDKPQMTDVHNNKIPFLLWQHALSFCTCQKCGQRAKPWDKSFTSVSTMSVIAPGGSTTRNVLKMMCADCVEQVIKEDELEKFQTKRAAVLRSVQQANKLEKEHFEKAGIKTSSSDSADSVQDREPVGEEPVGKNGSTIVVPGPKTIQ